MKITKCTPENLVEVFDVGELAGTDADVLAATETLIPIEAKREPVGEPFISWREHDGFEALAEEYRTAKSAKDRAEEQVKAVLDEAVATGMSEHELARKLDVDRMTIRRWRGKA
jgi:hypothetical protein